MEVLNVTVLACLMSVTRQAPNQADVLYPTAIRQTDNVRFNVESGSSPAETIDRPGLARLTSIESALNIQSSRFEEDNSVTKGTPLRRYQSANYKLSRPIPKRPRRDGNCLVYKVDPCRGKRCQTAESLLQFAEVWLPGTDLRYLPRAAASSQILNISLDVFHRNPRRHRPSRRSSTHTHLGHADVDSSQRGVASKPWIFVDLQKALPLVDCIFQRSRPVYVRMCNQFNQTAGAPTLAHPEALEKIPEGMYDPHTKPFLAIGYVQEQQSLLQFLDSSNLRVTITRDDEDQRHKRNVQNDDGTTSPTAADTDGSTPPPDTIGTTEPTAMPSLNRSCGRVPFTLNLSSIDSSKVFRPPQLKLWYCAGTCTSESKTNSDFAALRRLATANSDDARLQYKECCVPRRFSPRRTPIAWEDMETGEISELRTLNDSHVEECGCT